MKCPHCKVEFYDYPEEKPIGVDADGGWILIQRECPACKRIILELQNGEPSFNQYEKFDRIIRVNKNYLVRPKTSLRTPCPSEVPKEFAEDYIEACLVISDSPKASAALSRRCLQHILREVVKVKPGKLSDEIQQVINSRTLPSHLVEVIDVVRNIGNFAAHPLKREKGVKFCP
jgi:hypothetical protein